MLTDEEKDLIEFLYKHQLECECEKETINYLETIEGNYKSMFEASSSYHDDDRLTPREVEIIERLYLKFREV